tara:strand:- start:491 stop:1219 length:729 start_codon:yes stop_codon:yes gene_type:complete
MNHIKKHGGIHTLNKGGMYDAIMKFMGGGNMKYMQEGGKPDFLDLDKDGNKTESMKSAAASAKEMGKGGRMYRMGGVNEMEHGGGLKVLIKAMQEGGMLNMMEHGGVHKYPGGGMMPRKYQEGGEMSGEPKVDIIDKNILVGGSMIKKQKPGGGFEYVPKPEYADEAMFFVDGVPATFADAKFAFEQTSDAAVGLDFNDYIEKYTKQRGAYDINLQKQRESLGKRAEAAGTAALLRALRDMR